MTPGARSQVAAGLVAAVALQACGGGGASNPPRIGPNPVETPAAALKRFEAALARGCPKPRGVLHGAPNTRALVRACRRTLAGVAFRDPAIETFRSGALVELPGTTLTLALDTDRRWKVAFRGSETKDGGSDDSADRLAQFAVSTLRQENCHELVRYAFAYNGEHKWCARPRITELSNDLLQNYGVKPRRLGREQGTVFYGIATPEGRYWTMVLSSEKGRWFYYDAYKAQ